MPARARGCSRRRVACPVAPARPSRSRPWRGPQRHESSYARVPFSVTSAPQSSTAPPGGGVRHWVQLIAYADRFGGDLRGLRAILEGPLDGVFTGVHVLPFYRPFDGADAGFDPEDHLEVDARLGTWSDVATLGRSVEVMADLIVNHMSVHSQQFQDFIDVGDASEHAAMFLTMSSVFPVGATEHDLTRIYRPRAG